MLTRIWEAVSPGPILTPFETDYRWLTQVYTSVQPTSGTGKLIWHALGAKTIELRAVALEAQVVIAVGADLAAILEPRAPRLAAETLVTRTPP